MTAVRYRLGVVLRHRVVSTALSTVVVAVVGRGRARARRRVHRTATAPDRYTARYGGGVDVTVTQQGGRPRTAAVRKLPALRSVESITFVFGGLTAARADSARAGASNASVFGGSFIAAGAHLIEGRPPDPSRRGEFVATKGFESSAGAKLGDHFVRWITCAALWQALSITVVPVVIGIPIGLLGGARVFRLFSDAMRVVDSASAPLLIAAGVGVAVFLLAVLAALAAIRRPAVRPRRCSCEPSRRTE
jgi:hypothetical protein